MLAAVFAGKLWRLFTFANGDELFSYIPLMPFVCGYLAWMRRDQIPRQSLPMPFVGGLFFAGGALVVAGCFLLRRSPAFGTVENLLALTTLSWVLCLTGAGCWFLGAAAMRALAFPFCLLLFMVPLPDFARTAIETALQHGSATVADWMFSLSMTPVWREGMVLRLPRMSIEVAPECSGIHSTWILLITSLVAGHVVLRQPWKRVVLCLAVIPLALLRNGFRVFVIGELCTHIGPEMINSPIHRRGGPIFFLLSLIPFFMLLYFFGRGGRTGGQPSKSGK